MERLESVEYTLVKTYSRYQVWKWGAMKEAPPSLLRDEKKADIISTFPDEDIDNSTYSIPLHADKDKVIISFKYRNHSEIIMYSIKGKVLHTWEFQKTGSTVGSRGVISISNGIMLKDTLIGISYSNYHVIDTLDPTKKPIVYSSKYQGHLGARKWFIHPYFPNIILSPSDYLDNMISLDINTGIERISYNTFNTENTNAFYMDKEAAKLICLSDEFNIITFKKDKPYYFLVQEHEGKEVEDGVLGKGQEMKISPDIIVKIAIDTYLFKVRGTRDLYLYVPFKDPKKINITFAEYNAKLFEMKASPVVLYVTGDIIRILPIKNILRNNITKRNIKRMTIPIETYHAEIIPFVDSDKYLKNIDKIVIGTLKKYISLNLYTIVKRFLL